MNERAWVAAAAQVLRVAGRLADGAPDEDAWEALARTSVEGLRIPPLGTAGRITALGTTSAIVAGPGQAPFLRGAATSAGGWDVRALIADPDPAAANRAALADVAGGVTSLWIQLGPGATEPADLPAVLRGVRCDEVPVVLQCRRPHLDLAAAQALSGLAGTALWAPGSNLGADPIGRAARAHLAGGPSAVAGPAPRTAGAVADSMADLLEVASNLKVRPIVIDATVAHDAGAGDAGELGYALAAGATYLRGLSRAGVDIDSACGMLDFRFTATDEQFLTIAKLRAARLAWHRVAELSGASPTARAQRQHAVTSAAMLTRYDPWVNLLRTTVAAFAAGVAGAQAVTVLPFDTALGIPAEFGRRLARNVSAILLGESRVAAAADPAGGAYAVEMLTADLAEAAWAEFGRIEASGGILAALADGSLAGRMAPARAERMRRIATRKQPITGVSEFPYPGEVLPVRRRAPEGHQRAVRWAEPFETLRDHPAEQPVLLVPVGSESAAAVRLRFARNLLAAGGIPVIEASPDADLGAEVRRTGCRVVFLAGADADYRARLATLAEDAKQAGGAAVFVAGRPTGVLAALADGAISGTVAAGDDVLRFLRTVRAALKEHPTASARDEEGLR